MFAAWAATLLAPSWAVAQQAAPRSQSVAVLRATAPGVPAELAESVDSALARDLFAVAGIDRLTISPVDYAEIQITVGCEDESRDCLEAIAQTAQVEAIVVRRLAVDDAGTTKLELLYFDTHAAEPRHAQREADSGGVAELNAAMPNLVRELLGLAPAEEPAVSTEPAATDEGSEQPADGAPSKAPASAKDTSAGIGTWTWVSLGAGVAVLGTGLVFGALAQSDYDQFESASVNTRAQADRANTHFDAAHNEATLANVLVPAGALVLGLGVTLLVLDLSNDSGSGEHGARASLGATPLLGGGMLSFSGTFESAP